MPFGADAIFKRVLNLTGEGMENVRKDAAPPGEPTDWTSIDWKYVMRFVGKAQMRIAQAEMDRDYRRVKRLQRSLVRSWQAKAVAVRNVTTNQGKRTSGIDRVLWDTPDKKWRAIGDLNPHGYRARPLRRVYIPKSNGKERPLGIPTLRDRAMQALYLLALEPAVECKSDPNSYGFRKQRSTHDARQQLFVGLSQKGSARWVLDADISGFFDHINHEWLLAHVHMDKRVLRQWLKSGVVDAGQLLATEEGTPQGGIISPLLANITLNGLERGLAQFVKNQLGTMATRRAKVGLVRYADDFVVTGDSPELLQTTVVPWVEGFLRERGLQLSREKTRVVHIDQGFDFLGWNFRKYSEKLLIKPSRKNVQTFYGKVRDIIASSIALPTDTLIKRLNPILRGWAQYHQGVVAKATFSRIDNQIFWRLMRWGHRRHPRKTRGWIYPHYWLDTGTRRQFTGNGVDRWGEKVQVRLYSLADTKIIRHLKVKGDFNPFDPAWEAYGEKLRTDRMRKQVWDYERLMLWMHQDGKCALCQSEIDAADDNCDDHHIVYRRLGGTDALSNRVLLHPVCHRRVHALGLAVAKPAPVKGL